MTVTLGPLVVEAADPTAVTRFWRAALGDEVFGRLMTVESERQPKTVKNRVHLDVYVRELAVLLNLGATVLDDYPPMRATMADVEGNEFCAFIEPALEPVPLAQVFAICTDSSDPRRLAAWWAAAVGADVDPGPDGVPRYLSGCAGWMDVTRDFDVVWKFNEVDDQRVAPNRWRWTVSDWPDSLVDPEHLVDPQHQVDPEHLVDPDGNEFSVRTSPAG